MSISQASILPSKLPSYLYIYQFGIVYCMSPLTVFYFTSQALMIAVISASNFCLDYKYTYVRNCHTHVLEAD